MRQSRSVQWQEASSSAYACDTTNTSPAKIFSADLQHSILEVNIKHETTILTQCLSIIQTIEKRQGLKQYCPEEIAYRLGYISAGQVEAIAAQYKKNEYGQYLLRMLKEKIYS